VQYGDQTGYKLHVVDGGYSEIGEQVIEHIEQYYGRDVTIQNMVVSHADNDHARGLIPVFKRFPVGALWMNRPWIYTRQVIDHFHGNWTVEGWIREVKSKHEYLVELEALAARRGIQPNPVFKGAQIGSLLVLAPSIERYISLIPDLDKTPPPYKSEVAPRSLAAVAVGLLEAVRETVDIETLDPNPPATSASNETSVVQLGLYDNRKILLTADVGPEGLMEAARYAYGLGLLSPPDLVQIPHQGSRRNVTPAALNAWLGAPNGGNPRRGTAMVMVGAGKKEHPRKKVKNGFIRRGYPVFVGREGWMRMPYGYESRGANMTPEPFSYGVEED
jgi:hypothetical protein